jgi:predicted Fe-Mo cluster-binding NifX family protein
MKIAVVTNNGRTVSQHFGRARYYKIYTIEDNQVKSSEMRERNTGHFGGGHGHGHHSHHEEHGQGRHGYGAEAFGRHAAMLKELSDCNVLIAGGMGMGAYENFRSAGMDVILTDERYADEAVKLYLDGKLRNLIEERTD